jgi:hypothetical protein
MRVANSLGGNCMSARHSSPIIFKKFITACGLASLLFIVSCSTLNPHNVQVELQEDFPTAKITTFDDALVMLGQMTEIYDVPQLRIQCQPINDFTGTYTSSLGGELPQNITEMLKSSLNSIGGRVTFIPYDPAFLENSRITGYSKFEKKLVPDIAVSGGITEFDRGLETRGKNLNAGVETNPFSNVPDWFPGETIGVEFDQGQKISTASITVDFNLIDFETLSGIPRMQTVNTIKVYKGSNEKELGITLFGPTFGIKGSIKKVQGRHAAVRMLSQLSTIQIVGRYLKLPYWRLLPNSKPDQVVLEALQSDFYNMSNSKQIAAIQRLLYLHSYDVPITGQMDVQTQAVLTKFGAQTSISADIYTDLYVSVPLDSHRYLTLNQAPQKTSQLTEPSSGIAIPPVSSVKPSTEPAKGTPIKTLAPSQKPSIYPTKPKAAIEKQAVSSGNPIAFDKVVSRLTSLGLYSNPADLHLWTNQSQFLIGDRIHYYFKTERDCHVVVIGLTTEGKVVQLFPNRYQSKPLVNAGQTYVIVDDQAEMALEITGPAGREEVIAFVSEHPIELFPGDFTKEPFLELSMSQDQLKNVISRIQAVETQNISQKRIQYQIISK